MDANLVFIPILLHFVLVFFLMIKLGSEKSKAFKQGLTDPKVTALDPKAWPDNVVKISNNIGNQFETPMLFYALVFIFFLMDAVSFITIGLMLLYVASRYLHSYLHITKNFVPNRFKAFTFGLVILLIMTLWLFILILG